VQNHVAPVARALRVLEGRVAVGRADHPGQESALAGGQTSRVLAEIALGGGAHSVDRRPLVLTEVHRVEIRLEDLFLGTPALEGYGQHALADLPAPRPLRPQREVLHQLLRQRARPLSDLAPGRVDGESAPDRHQVHPGMLEKPVILGREHGRRDEGRQVGERKRPPTLGSRVADPGQELGLQLQRLGPAGSADNLADPGALVEERDADGGPAEVGASAKMDLPPAACSMELSGRSGLARHLPVREPVEAVGDRPN